MPDLIDQALAALSLDELAELDALLVSGGPLDFRSFVADVRPTYQWYPHCAILGQVLEDVADGKRRRVIVQEPPRHGKSEEVTRLFSAYYLRRFPDRWVGINTYSSDLSYVMSRAAQRYYQGLGQEHDLSVEAVKHWETADGGGLWAAGVGGPITGKGFHLGIVDDPIKNAEEAASPVIRRKQQEWWDSTFYTRAEPDAAIIVITTRWHEDDLVGYLLSKETEAPERWHIVNLPALAEPLPPYPPTCTVEPDWRTDGEALCPERYTKDDLERIRGRIGSYFFEALFQQRPHPREGGIFKREWFTVIEQPPALLESCRGWDQAATDQGGDYTAGVKLGKGQDGKFYILDAVRGQWDSGARDANIRLTAQLDGRQCWIQGEQEPGASGKTVAQAFVRMLAGYEARVIPSSGDKTLRASLFAAQCAAGNVRLVRGDWNKSYVEELCSFPTGRHDDLVDATALAFNRLASNVVGQSVKPISLTQVSKWR